MASLRPLPPSPQCWRVTNEGTIQLDRATLGATTIDGSRITVAKRPGVNEVSSFSALLFRQETAASLFAVPHGSVTGTLSSRLVTCSASSWYGSVRPDHAAGSERPARLPRKCRPDHRRQYRGSRRVQREPRQVDSTDYDWEPGEDGDELLIDVMDVTITDDDAPTVLVQQPDGRTVVIEATEFARLGEGFVRIEAAYRRIWTATTCS